MTLLSKFSTITTMKEGTNMRLEVAYEIARTCQDDEDCTATPTHFVRLDDGIYFLCEKHAEQYEKG